VPTENDISRIMVESAVEAHRTLRGPGLFGERLVRDGIHRVVNQL
jgi:hypothetical protein